MGGKFKCGSAYVNVILLFLIHYKLRVAQSIRIYDINRTGSFDNTGYPFNLHAVTNIYFLLKSPLLDFLNFEVRTP